MKNVLVTKIQRFSLHDGPGIRTTVFLKGCNLHCPWCCNPENIKSMPEYYYERSRCIVEHGTCIFGQCVFAERGEISRKLSSLSEEGRLKCKSGAIGIYGKEYVPSVLVEELLKDRDFWGDTGGITFSGGEPLLQFEALQPTLLTLKEKGINLCLETALFVDSGIVEKALDYFDFIYVDVKILDEKDCARVLGGNLEQYLHNLSILKAKTKNVCLRYPVIKGYTDDAKNRENVYRLRQQLDKWGYEELPEHHLGNEKYHSLGLKVDREGNEK